MMSQVRGCASGGLPDFWNPLGFTKKQMYYISFPATAICLRL